MSDIKLDSNNDLFLLDGQIVLIEEKEELVRQRLMNRLQTFTNSLWTNRFYGIDVNLLGIRTSNTVLMDREIKLLISQTKGIIRLVEFSSRIGIDRVYRCTFKYQIETGEIIGIKGLNVKRTLVPIRGVFYNGYWHYDRRWDTNETWGIDGGKD